VIYIITQEWRVGDGFRFAPTTDGGHRERRRLTAKLQFTVAIETRGSNAGLGAI